MKVGKQIYTVQGEELDDAHEGEGGCSLSWRGRRWVKVVDFAPPVAVVVEEEMVKISQNMPLPQALLP